MVSGVFYFYKNSVRDEFRCYTLHNFAIIPLLLSRSLFMPSLARAWLGYDLPYDDVERHPFVQNVRQKGLRKRIPQPEHHVTVGFFESIDTVTLAKTLSQIQAKLGFLERADITFDGYGIIASEKGKYLYLSPDITPTLLPERLKRALEQTPVYKQDENCHDLHLSIGGADPFSQDKPRRHPMPEALTVSGRLILVGKQGESFLRFAWNDAEEAFLPIDGPAREPAPQRAPERTRTPAPVTSQPAPTKAVTSALSRAPLPINTIAIYPKIQADTATAVFIIQKYGGERYPGIETANVVFWNRVPEGQSAEDIEASGTLLLDLGGRYDHHVSNKAEGKRSECLSTLVAKDLDVEQNPELKKVLSWAKRDDLEGKGTVSADPLDRAFGLSGIIMNFNRLYRDRLPDALRIILEIIAVHVQEEYKRTVELPQEWDRLVASGEIQFFQARQGSAGLQCSAIQSDNVAFAGFAKAAKKMDLIVQRSPTGHTNIITQQLRSLDLRPVIAALRQAERAALGLPPVARPSTASGLADDVTNWYYDDAANTIQNGGIDPQGLPATKLSLERVIDIVKNELPKGIIGSLKREKEAGAQH